MVNENISENIEEYLEVLYRYGNNKEQVSNATFSKELNIAPASVTQMIKKLENLKYINYEPYQGASLTDKGMKVAQLITRKHRILEIVLFSILNINEKNIHEQACAMEHVLSDEALKSLCLLLHQPDISPFLNIIPACDLDFKNCIECSNMTNFEDVSYRKKNLLAISELKIINNGVVSFIRGNGDLYNEIINLGIDIGAHLDCNETNDGFLIFVNGKEIKISNKLANNIFLLID